MFLRRRIAIAGGIALVGLLAPLSPALAHASGGAGPNGGLSADLNGKPIPLVQVGNHFCDDFDYPLIHCFTTASALDASDAQVLSATSVEYVTIYDYPLYAGSYMHVSQDYTVLATIGWNDRVSSFIVRNGQEGHFYTDWFYGGTGYYFCCSQMVNGLGSYDNTFSSVHIS